MVSDAFFRLPFNSSCAASVQSSAFSNAACMRSLTSLRKKDVQKSCQQFVFVVVVVVVVFFKVAVCSVLNQREVTLATPHPKHNASHSIARPQP